MKLQGNHVFLRMLDTNNASAVLQLELKNRDFFQKYTALRADEFYTLQGQIDRINKNKEMIERDLLYSFGIFLNEDEKLIGTIALLEVLRGALQSCFVGYSLDQEQNGKGYMTEAVGLIVDFAFNELKLHRIEAGVMPHNLGSIKVLEKSGFHKEGIAKSNVKINGKWEDHQVLAIINDDETI
ncbi:GNAT family protein [Bacillus sp. CECT 9360]|uniref:GNAT family N-acetyltransferase n=1 Tax=Bacillus sp. CECT 9360 TaxID=2845821 RepID=UPI001E3E3ABE|nr:GNAT family protein [Bacillus sp. CECT 9360]CAH0346411.1 [Ribosomal protein S5]-alanine N-acetyltransferase [Bacillus sp. CECT 9360]